MAVGDINMEEERRRAELAKLQWETQLIEAQTKKARAEYDQKLQIEIAKTLAETKKIERETRWVPLAALSAIVAGFLAVIVTLIFKLIHG